MFLGWTLFSAAGNSHNNTTDRNGIPDRDNTTFSDITPNRGIATDCDITTVRDISVRFRDNTTVHDNIEALHKVKCLPI